jgi:uncharacterized membrane protein HdeD (DUF308 family)
MNAALARNWWAIGLRGILNIVFGLIAFAVPSAALLAFVIVFAAFAILDGILAIAASVRAARRHERWGLLLAEGVISLIAGGLAVALPGLTILGATILIGAWALVTGVLASVAAFQLNLDHGRIWMVIGALASVLLGFALIAAPLMGAIVLVWWIGAYAIVAGVAALILAARLRIHRHDKAPDLAATGPAAA